MMFGSILLFINATLETNQSFIVKIRLRDAFVTLPDAKEHFEALGFLSRLQLKSEHDEEIVYSCDTTVEDFQLIIKILRSSFEYQIPPDKFINVAVAADVLEIHDIKNISIYLTNQIQYNEEYLNIFKEISFTTKFYQDQHSKYARYLFFWTAKKIAEEFECSLIICKKEISLINSKNSSELNLIDTKNNFTLKLPIYLLKDDFLKFLNFEKSNDKEKNICLKNITNMICILNICLHTLVSIVNQVEFTPTVLKICGSNTEYFDVSSLSTYIKGNFLKSEWFLTIRRVKFVNCLLLKKANCIFRHFENLTSIIIKKSDTDLAFIFNLFSVRVLSKCIKQIYINNVTRFDKEITLPNSEVSLQFFSFKFLDPVNCSPFRNFSFLNNSKESLISIEFNINEKYNLENLRCIKEFKSLKSISFIMALQNVSKILKLLNIINEWFFELELEDIIIEIIQGIFTIKNYNFSKQTSLKILTLIGIIIDAKFFNVSNQTEVKIVNGWVMEFKNSENIFDKNIVMCNTLFSQTPKLIPNIIKIFMLQTRLRGLSINFNDLNLEVGETTFNFTSILFLRIYNYNEHTNKRAQFFFKAVKFRAPLIIEIYNSDNLPQLFEFLVLSNLTILTYVDCNVNGSILPNKDQLEKCPVKRIKIKGNISISMEDSVKISRLCILHRLKFIGHITPINVILNLAFREEFLENLQILSFKTDNLTYIE